MDNSISSLNSTFSIEEERSFLNNYGTPKNFKKLLDRPATVAGVKFNHNIPMSFKNASNIRLNHQLYDECNAENDNNSVFLSPLPISRNLQRNKFIKYSPILSPNNDTVSNNRKKFDLSKLTPPRSFLKNTVIISSTQQKYNYKSTDFDTFSPVKNNFSTIANRFSPCRDTYGNILKSSARKEQEERKQMQLAGVISPNTRTKALDQVRNDAKKINLKQSERLYSNSKEKLTTSYCSTTNQNTPFSYEIAINQNLPTMNNSLKNQNSPICYGSSNYHRTENFNTFNNFLSPISKSSSINTHSYILPPEIGCSSPLNNSRYKQESEIRKFEPFSPVQNNFSTIAKVFSPCQDLYGNILISSARKEHEERMQRQLGGEISPNTCQNASNQVHNKQFNLKQSERLYSIYNKENVTPRYCSIANQNTQFGYQSSDYHRTENFDASNNFLSPISKSSSINTDGNIVPPEKKGSALMNYRRYRQESEMKKLEPPKKIETELVMKTFGPILDHNGNIMMSSAKKKMLAEKEMQLSDIPTEAQREECLQIVMRDARNLEINMKKELGKEALTNGSLIPTKEIELQEHITVVDKDDEFRQTWLKVRAEQKADEIRMLAILAEEKASSCVFARPKDVSKKTVIISTPIRRPGTPAVAVRTVRMPKSDIPPGSPQTNRWR